MGSTLSSADSLCFDLVASKIAVGVNKELLSGKECKINSNWSPNNIRRLIVSPDGFSVQYHLVNGTTARSSFSHVSFGSYTSKEKLLACFSSEKYKTMTSALTAIRMCSCVEEIIYCTESSHGLSLPQKELDIKSLVKGVEKSTLEESLRARFPRLSAISVVNLTLVDFLEKYGSKLSNFEYSFGLESKAKGVIVINEIWYRYASLRGQYYPIDAEGGVLHSHFDKVRSVMEEKLKRRKLEELRERQLGEVAVELNKAIDSTEKMCNFAVFQKNVFKESNLFIPVDGFDLCLDVVKLCKNVDFSKNKLSKETFSAISPACKAVLMSLGVGIESASTIDRRNQVKADIEVLKRVSFTINKYATSVFVKAVKWYADNMPLSFECLTLDTRVNVRSNACDNADNITCLHVSENIDIRQSLVEMYTCLARLYVSDFVNPRVKEEVFWVDSFKKKGEGDLE